MLLIKGGRTSVADLPNLPFLAATIAEVIMMMMIVNVKR